MEPELDQSDHHGLLSPAVKLLIMAASLALASLIGFYLHPLLPPLLSDSIPQVWDSIPQVWNVAKSWLTAPILFLLLNLVVGSLYFSSSIRSRSKSRPRNPAHTRTPASTPSSTDSNERTSEDVAPAANSSRSTGGLRARIEKSRPFVRLVRSKSEQIPPSSTSVDLGGGRLKKAGTFEAGQSTRKPMVIVADPLEDESGPPPPGHEEVDKKAEDFISRFYHKVKLQRLDSLLRNQQQSLQQGQG